VPVAVSNTHSRRGRAKKAVPGHRFRDALAIVWQEMTIARVQELLELEMFGEAVQAWGKLPPELRGVPAALRTKARLAVALGRWEIAKATAELLEDGNALDRQEAARCHSCLAAEHFKHGRREAALASVRRALAAWPEQRGSIVHDERFPEEVRVSLLRTRTQPGHPTPSGNDT
jgi:hypothetical protein